MEFGEKLKQIGKYLRRDKSETIEIVEETNNELEYRGEVRLHYCTNNNCYPPTWFSPSQKSEECPDCKTISRVATPEEEHECRGKMGHPSGLLALHFILGDNRPQNIKGIIGAKLEKLVGK